MLCRWASVSAGLGQLCCVVGPVILYGYVVGPAALQD